MLSWWFDFWTAIGDVVEVHSNDDRHVPKSLDNVKLPYFDPGGPSTNLELAPFIITK